MSPWWLLAALAAGFGLGWLLRGVRAQAQLLRVGRETAAWAASAHAAWGENEHLRSGRRDPAAFHDQLEGWTRLREGDHDFSDRRSEER